MTKITKIHFYDPIYRKNGLKAWTSDREDCELALYFIYFYSDLSLLLQEQPLWESHFQDWSFKDFALSALYLYFEEEDISSGVLPSYILPYHLWFLLITFLLNVETTQDVYFSLKKNNFNKSLVREDIIEGVLYAFDIRTFPHANITCLENLLNFLEIDKSTIQYLLKSFQEKKSLTVINEFIIANKTNILNQN